MEKERKRERGRERERERERDTHLVGPRIHIILSNYSTLINDRIIFRLKSLLALMYFL